MKFCCDCGEKLIKQKNKLIIVLSIFAVLSIFSIISFYIDTEVEDNKLLESSKTTRVSADEPKDSTAPKTGTQQKEEVKTTQRTDICSENNFMGTSINKKNKFDEYKNFISNDVDCTISRLKQEYEELVTRVNTYTSYRESKVDVDNYYKKVNLETFNLIVRLRKYDSEAAKILVTSGDHLYNKFTDLDSLYNKVDSSCTRIENDIYQGILMDLKSFYHDGIIKNQKGKIPDSEYETAWNDSGSIHATIRHYVYNFYSKIDLDNFTLYTNLKTSFYNDNTKSSNQYINRFEKDTSGFVEVNKKYLK